MLYARTLRGSRNAGFVLIVMLVVLSGLSLLVLGVSYRSRLELRMAQYQCEQASARQVAEAGVVLACSRLAADDGEADYLAEEWHAGLSLGDLLAGDDADGPPTGQTYRAEVSGIDEESKLNIKLGLPADVLADLCGGDTAMAAAILDWMGPDEGGPAGGYQHESVPYTPKHASPEYPVELLLVEGVDNAAYYGEDADRNGLLDDGENDGARSFPLDDADGKLRIGLRDLLTTYGDGLVNVNTAPLKVLEHIPGLGAQAAESIVAWRCGTDGIPATDDDNVVRSWADLDRIPGLTEFERSVTKASCCIHSQFFSIVSAASRPDGKHRYKVELVVQRSGGRVTPVFRRETWVDPRVSAYQTIANQ